MANEEHEVSNNTVRIKFGGDQTEDGYWVPVISVTDGEMPDEPITFTADYGFEHKDDMRKFIGSMVKLFVNIGDPSTQLIKRKDNETMQ